MRSRRIFSDRIQYEKLLRIDDSLSPEHKAQLLALANSQTVAAFLAELFILIVSQSGQYITEGDSGEKKHVAVSSREEVDLSLVLRGIRDENLTENGWIKRAISNNRFEEQIKQLIERINKIHVYSTADLGAYSVFKKYPSIKELAQGINAFCFPNRRNVYIDEATQMRIKSIANCLQIALSKNFFCLGDLQEESLMVAFGNRKLFGQKTEKEKYELIEVLENKIKVFEKILTLSMKN